MIRKIKKYNENNVKEALRRILVDNWTVYKASKVYKIPWSTLKGRLTNPEEVVKVGRPFNLTQNDELQVVEYIQKLQELNFDVSCNQIRSFAYTLSEAKTKNFFNKRIKMAGWSWWVSFKRRYEDILQLNDYLALVRTKNFSNLEDFFVTLKEKVDNPGRLFNFGVVQLNYVSLFVTVNAEGLIGPTQMVVNDSEANTLHLNDSVLRDYYKLPSNFEVTITLDDQFYHFMMFFYRKMEGVSSIILMDFNEQVSLETLNFIENKHICLVPLPVEMDAPVNTILSSLKIYKKLNDESFLKKLLSFLSEKATKKSLLKAFSEGGIWPIDVKKAVAKYESSCIEVATVKSNCDILDDVENVEIKKESEGGKIVIKDEGANHFCHVCNSGNEYNELKWIECCECRHWYHFVCVNVNEYFPNFVCESCTIFSDDSD